MKKRHILAQWLRDGLRLEELKASWRLDQRFEPDMSRLLTKLRPNVEHLTSR